MRYKLLTQKECDLLEPIKDTLTEEEQNQYIYSICYYNIELFIDIFLPHWKTDENTGETVDDADFHRELTEEFRNGKDVAVEVPRNHAKSTRVRMFFMFAICYGIEKCMLLIASEGLGVKTLGIIRDEFETNEDITRVFGRMIPNSERSERSKSWTKRKLKFLNNCELFTITKDSKSKRGNRVSLIVVDDPQEFDDVKNKKIADEYENEFFTSIYNMLSDSGRCIILGTAMGPNSFIERIRMNPRGFKIITYKAISNINIKILEEGKKYKLFGKEIIGDGKKHLIGGEPLWPAKWTLRALSERYTKLLSSDGIDDDKFYQEFMNESIIMGGKTFYEKSFVRNIVPIKPIRRDEIIPELLIYKEPEFDCNIGSDVSEGNINGDYSTIRGRSKKDGSLLFSYRGHIHPFDFPRVFDRIYKLGYIGMIGIERNNHGLTVLKGILDGAVQYPWASNVYFERKIDKITQRYSDKPGWLTTGSSRAYMLDKHLEALLNGDLEVDEDLKEEMFTFYKNEKGKPEAVSPYHDDVIIGDSICLQMQDFHIYAGIKV